VPSETSSIYRFGVFELDPRSGELRKQGGRVRLQDQQFRILVKLLERRGEVVSREELRSTLWPEDTFVDFETGLNTAIKRLRGSLGDSADHPIFIETLPKRGYKFIAPVEFLEPQNGQLPRSTAPNQAPPTIRFPLLRYLIPAMLVLLLLVIGAAVWSLRSPHVPNLADMVQITNDGKAKSPMNPFVTDGVHLYFIEGMPYTTGSGIAQVSETGGEITWITTSLREPLAIYSISPDGSKMLLVDGAAANSELAGELWEQPLPAGSARRVGDTMASSATWTPDQTHIVYSDGEAILIANDDGSNPHELATLPGVPRALRFSPDGRRLRFYLTHPDTESRSIWEMDADGKNVHPLLPGWQVSPYQCCGNWSPDGNFYYFQAGHDSTQSIWVLPTRKALFSGSTPVPSLLTSGPLRFSSPVPSRDGKKIFVVGENSRVELTRYDPRTHRFDPFLHGISAGPVDFSHDGRWVTYVSYPEMTLWRCRMDGSEKTQLTFPPARVYEPRWSPDDSRIVFMDVDFTHPWKIRLMPSSGGAVTPLVPSDSFASQDDPTWAPDGNSIIFGASGGADRATVAIYRMDMHGRKMDMIPASEGYFSPRLSPDGRYISAITEHQTKLMLYDVGAREWSTLAEAELLGYNEWSHDGRYIYMRENRSGAGELVRVRVKDRVLEPVLSFKDFPQLADMFAAWIGLTPDDAPLLMRDRSVQEIYALDLHTR